MPDQPTIVAAIVTSPQGVLLARRQDGKPKWTFPSGAQEAGEGYADTAVREALEETGLTVIARDLIGDHHPTTGRPMVYIAADPVNGTEVRVGDSDEHSQVGWYPWATAEGMLPHLFEPVADHLRATFPA